MRWWSTAYGQRSRIVPSAAERCTSWARRELVIIPAQVKIREHVRYTYFCRHCEESDITVPVVKAAAPAPVIQDSLASPEAIAHIAAQKFVMGIPLYRQEQDWKRQGLALSRQTASN